MDVNYIYVPIKPLLETTIYFFLNLKNRHFQGKYIYQIVSVFLSLIVFVGINCRQKIVICLMLSKQNSKYEYQSEQTTLKWKFLKSSVLCPLVNFVKFFKGYRFEMGACTRSQIHKVTLRIYHMYYYKCSIRVDENTLSQLCRKTFIQFLIVSKRIKKHWIYFI